ncbi:MAG: hypothetical protein OXT68_01670 [Chloroflexota bacterium]|nr:hypothetical protein [Chloroflexota bacterium]
MQIQKHSTKGRRSGTCAIVLIAAGLLSLVLVAVLLLSPALPTILLRVLGFEPIRRSDAPVSEEAIATLANPVNSSLVTFITQDFGRFDMPPGSDLEVAVGEDALGARVLQIVFRDTDMLNLCLQFTRYCEGQGSPIRRARIRIADGLITISGEAFLDLINVWDAIEIHVAATRDGVLKFDSISLDGIRYKLPANALGDRIRHIEATLARIVKQLQVLSSGGVFSFAGFDLSDNRLVASFR